MAGRYFDAWQVGDRIVHDLRRTVTETDNLLISTLTHNPQPLHLDAEFAGATEFGRIVVNGTFTFALMVGISVGDTTLGTLVANLALRPSKSRPGQGVVTFRHVMLNQRDETVCTCLRSALLHAKATA